MRYRLSVLLISILALASCADLGLCGWSSKERPMSGHPNVNGCWMVVAVGEAAVESEHVPACGASTSCLVVESDATVWAYSGPGKASFTALDVPCSARCQ